MLMTILFFHLSEILLLVLHLGTNIKNEKETSNYFQVLLQLTEIPHLNRNIYWEKHPNLNTHKLYKQYYNEEWIKEWVREKYKNDFSIFNYELDI